LNLAQHVGDDPLAVQANRQRLVEQAPLPEQPRWLRQVHGVRVVHADAVERDHTEADAVWTDRPNQVCAVLVADCVPILLASRDGRSVAAVHAGWRGLAGGVIQAAVTALPAHAEDMMACIGPCISPAAYEVGDEVVAALQTAGVNAQYKRTPAVRLDLSATAAEILRDCGVGSVSTVWPRTDTQPERLYSYRRANRTGRFAGFITPFA